MMEFDLKNKKCSKKNHKIFVAGHKGLVGSAVCIKLKEYGFKKIITAKKYS